MSGESSNADKDCQGDAAVDQSADAIQKSLSLAESEPRSPNEDTIQPGADKKSTNQRDKSSENTENTVKTSQTLLDQNANVELQDKAKKGRKKGKDEQDQQLKETPAPKPKMIFGPQNTVDLIKILIFKLVVVVKLKPQPCASLQVYCWLLIDCVVCTVTG